MFSFPIIREMQKPQWDTISYPWRPMEIFNWIISSVGKDLGQWNVISTTTLENNLALSSKFKDIHSPRPSNSTSRYTAGRSAFNNCKYTEKLQWWFTLPRSTNCQRFVTFALLSYLCMYKTILFSEPLENKLQTSCPLPQIFQHRFT